jgi:hypothetical protein
MAKNSTLGNKYIDKFSNYNYYFVGRTITFDAVKEVTEERLLKVLKAINDLLKKPYLRFMFAKDQSDAVAIVYDNNVSVTKLVPLSDIEKMIEERKFHK